MWMFSKGQTKQSLTRLETVLSTYPDDLNANFYAGLCYYNLQQYGKAIACFNVCLENYFQNFDEETIWYMARSYFAKGDKHIAMDLFRKIKQAGGFYSDKAKEFIGD
jgi:tetratricopeptide (TPR) repeat protein